MRSLIRRPHGRETGLSFEAVIQHARLLGDQGRETMTELNVLRARVESGLVHAEQALLQASVAVRRANQVLNAIRGAGVA